MSVGQGSLDGLFSYIGIGRETTFGTAVTATAQLEFLSSSLKVAQENKVLEEIQRRRVQSKLIKMGKVIEGDIEFYAKPENTAMGYLLQNAFGGAISSATTTVEGAETTGGGGFDHTFDIGNIVDQTYTSLTISHRKGDSASAKVFEYSGMRVGEMSIVSELDEALKMTYSFMGKDFTNTGTDQASNFTATVEDCLSFDSGRISIETSFAGLTTTSFWHVQSVNLSVNNNLKGDAESRRIGTDTLDVLPSGMANISLVCSVRFDTTTSIDAMLAKTQLSAQLDFRGDTMSGSVAREGLRFNMPRIYVAEAGDPEVSGPDGQLTSEVTFNVLLDDSSASGYALQGILTNTQANYN